MKPFDLEAAKRGEPIQTRDGRPVKFIAHVPEANESQQVLVLIDEDVRFRYPTGRFHSWEPDRADVLMASRKRTVWVNLYEDGIARWHYTETTADSFPKLRIENRAFPLEIEE